MTQPAVPGEPAESPPTVVFVVGTARSGSTILAALLNQYAGWFGAGELGYLWQRGLDPEKHCACGAVVLECPVWRPVLADGLGAEPAAVDYRRGTEPFWGVLPSAVMAAHQDLVSGRPRQVSETSSAALWAETIWGVYSSIARVTEASVVVDTSKHVGEAAVHLSMDQPPVLIHLIRDPRAVVHSGLRRPYIGGGGRGPMAASRLAASWMKTNLAAQSLLRSWPEDRSMTIRYEDFAADPEAVVGEIHRIAVGSTPAVGMTDAGFVADLSNHIVSGGTARTNTKDVQIRPDTRWRDGLTAAERRTVSALTLPLSRRFGYR